MQTAKTIGKREFIQHTSKYIKWVEEHDSLIITHHNAPDLIVTKIKPKTFSDLRGTIQIIIHGDINEPILPGYDTW